jgi:hypothetical protein
VGVELRFYSVLENCSRVGTAAAWPMKASKNPWASAWKGAEDPDAIGRVPEHVRTISEQAERDALADV